MRVWLHAGLLLSVGLGAGLSACRQPLAARQAEPAAVPANARPAPQPSVCAAENQSRAALLKQASARPSPSPQQPKRPRR
jgi:hypothetical protein